MQSLLLLMHAAPCFVDSSFTNSVRSNVTRLAAFAVLTHPNTLAAVPGAALTRDAPVFAMNVVGAAPWELNVNNGYSSVLYDPQNPHGLGVYRAFYSAGDDGFKSPDCSTSECAGGSATLEANSSDGLRWEKPGLGLWSWTGVKDVPAPGKKYAAADTNILFESTTAVAIFDDGAHEKNASRRFKAWGNLAAQDISPKLGGHAARPPWRAPQTGGLAVSADGLRWTDYKMLQNATDERRGAWRFDAQASMFFDERRQKYVGTDRAFRPCSVKADCGTCPIWWQPHGGCQSHPSISNKTGCSKAQCARTVRAIGAVSSSGADFGEASWGRNEEILANHSDPTTQFYSQVTWPFYNVYLGITMVYDAVDPPDVYGKGKVHCELTYSADPTFSSGWQRLAEGRDFIPLGMPRGEGKGAWDSHICFASALPLRLENEVRVFYMGGDGPHYSKPWPSSNHRNSSFGLATLRQDGFVALRGRSADGAGKATTVALDVPAGRTQLLISVDTAINGASVTITVNKELVCTPVAGRNVTDYALQTCSLKGFSTVTLDITLSGGALLYTVGFAAAAAAPAAHRDREPLTLKADDGGAVQVGESVPYGCLPRYRDGVPPGCSLPQWEPRWSMSGDLLNCFLSAAACD